ncbi:hypothetical protein BV20DRAFT_527689 [Pilatotrama ljubarskyi]|nr:hypothetical protein BV20DRAFT_527689 [Pilatotrama ljubarskyi]
MGKAPPNRSPERPPAVERSTVRQFFDYTRSCSLHLMDMSGRSLDSLLEHEVDVYLLSLKYGGNKQF